MRDAQMTVIPERLALLDTIDLCGCGCGQPAPLAQRTNRRLGQVKGQPLPFRSDYRQGRWSGLNLAAHVAELWQPERGE